MFDGNFIRKALAAAVIIQNWFRRRQALLEIRRKAAWTIYQNIEYAGEQDQLKVNRSIDERKRKQNLFDDVDLVVQLFSRIDANDDR